MCTDSGVWEWISSVVGYLEMWALPSLGPFQAGGESAWILITIKYTVELSLLVVAP